MGLTKYVKPYSKQFTLASVAKLAEAFLELYLPILMAQILDNGIPNQDKTMILITGGKMLGFAVLGFLCALTCQYFASVTAQGSGTLIRNALMEKISGFSYLELDNLGTSSLINRITNDVNNYQWATAMTMRLVTRAPFICIGAVIMSLRIDKELATIFFFLIPILSLVLFIFMRFASPLYRTVQKKLDEFTLILKENLSGIRVIRAFATTEREEKRAKKSADEISDASIKVSLFSSWMQPINSLVLNIGIILILYFGANRVYGGHINQGDILSLSMYATKILYAVVVTANLVVVFTKASASSKRIVEILEKEPAVTFKDTDILEFSENAPKIEFKDVSFAYSGENSYIKHVSFSVPTGKTFGIVGITGSGKSSVVNLTQRLYDVSDGEILIDGYNIKDYPKAQLRDKIGIVPQNNVLFSGSIKENIKIGAPSATDEDILKALEVSQCSDFVSNLPKGLDSPVFEGGKNFSGGQKQRLTIARALAKNPEILILDDSLSALDYQTDLNLRRALKAYDESLTTIIISQRISSVISADNILVMSHGNIVGCGTHNQLLESCIEYQEIYESQSEKEAKNGY